MSIENTERNKDSKKAKYQIYTDNISHEIGETIINPDSHIIQKINNIINKSIRFISKNDIKKPETQKEVFEQIISFFNNIFSDIEIKKFYNNIPKTDLQSYSKKTLWEKFMHNIYGKQRKLFYKDIIEWGDCYYWTVLFKEFFDKLEKIWMNIQTNIFLYDNKWWGHAWVTINFQWKDYIIDISWFNANFGDLVIQSIDDLNKKSESNLFDNFSCEKIKQYKKQKSKKHKNEIIFFSNIQDFVENVSKKEISNAVVEFNPNLDGESSKNIRFDFYPNKILLTIDNAEHTFKSKNPKTIPNITNEKFFDYFISNIAYISSKDKTKNTPFKNLEEKTILVKYLSIIRNKINISKLRQIYWC